MATDQIQLSPFDLCFATSATVTMGTLALFCHCALSPFYPMESSTLLLVLTCVDFDVA